MSKPVTLMELILSDTKSERLKWRNAGTLATCSEDYPYNVKHCADSNGVQILRVNCDGSETTVTPTQDEWDELTKWLDRKCFITNEKMVKLITEGPHP